MRNLIYILIISSVSIFSQDAKKLADEALIELQEKNYDNAIQLFDSAYAVSGDYVYLYEKAFVFYRRKNFKAVVEIIESFIMKTEPNEKYYQLLGSSYDFLGENQTALRVLRRGIERIPNSGRLYYELGVTEYGMGNKREAIGYWDMGIKEEPNYPNNYFQLMKETYDNEKFVYALVFAELFLNLPADDEKKKEASSLIYNTYKKALEKNNTKEPDFTEFVGDYNPQKASEAPFRISFQQIANQSYSTNESTNFEEIVSFRIEFISQWFERGFNELYPNPLFDYHKKLLDNGHLEAYSYLMLSSGDNAAYMDWLNRNSVQVQEFIVWWSENPIDLKKNKFTSSIYLSE